MDYRDALRFMDFSTRHKPFVEDFPPWSTRCRLSPVLLLPFCMIFRAHGNNRTVLPRVFAQRYPAYRCPMTFTPTQHIHLRTMWLQDIDLCSLFDNHIMVKYTGLNHILAHQGHLPIDSSSNTAIVPRPERARLHTNVDSCPALCNRG